MARNLPAPVGDPVAQCYSRHADRLRLLLLRLSRSPQLAEDLSQDIWVKVTEIQRGENARAQDLTSFETPSAQWSYLSRMALNRYRDWLRQKRTLSIEDLAERISPDSAMPETSAEVVDHLTSGRIVYERLRRLQESMDAILEAFSQDTSPPHQIIVFGFNRPLQWEPNKIVQIQSHQTLLTLGKQLCSELAEAFLHNAVSSHGLCRRLEKRLGGPIVWEHVRAPNAAKTELAIYFKRKDLHGKAKEVTQWSLSVQRRILKRLLAVSGIAARNKE